MGAARDKAAEVAAVLWRTLERHANRLVGRRGWLGFGSDDVASQCMSEVLARLDGGSLEVGLAAFGDDALENLVRRVLNRMARPLRRERQARRNPDCRRLHPGVLDPVDASDPPPQASVPDAHGEAAHLADDGLAARSELRTRLGALDPPPTAAQVQVLLRRAEGVPIRRIAAELGLDPSSVRERLRRVFRRLRGESGVPSPPTRLPDPPRGFFRGHPARWRRVYVALRRGEARHRIAQRERLQPKALQALILRLRRSIEATLP